MDIVLAICGMAGGILCAVGDVLFDLKGPGNRKLGTSGNIDSSWARMSYGRFGASLLCAFVGAPGIALGIVALAHHVMAAQAGLGWALFLMGIAVASGGIFLHTVLCVQAVVYKGIIETGTFEVADHALEQLYRQVMAPFVLTLLLEVAVSACVVAAVLGGSAGVPAWCALLNPVVFTLVGLAFRKLDGERFRDLPGIVMPSLGCGCLGLVALLAALA